MQPLTRDQLLGIVGITGGTFDQLQHADHVALAFGTPAPAAPGRYLDLDACAIAMNEGLSVSLGRSTATALVGGFFHQWGSAVGKAEACPDHDYFFAVAGVGRDERTKSAKLLLVTHGTPEEIANDFRNNKDMIGYFVVNVSDILRRLRARAEELGIDLSRQFFFPPDDPRFETILIQVKRERDARLARLRRDKKRFAAVKRRSLENVAVVRRVADAKFPFAIGLSE
jgi:hypothetical protein